MERGLTQAQLADALFVNRTTVVKWENGSRMPDAIIMSKISDVLDIDLNLLISSIETGEQRPKVILIDDEKIILSGGLPILERVMPDVEITGFDRPSAAVDFALNNKISLAFLDIEMGKNSGLDICSKLLKINPFTNVIFLTAYVDYSFDAWSTGACGFILKPLTEEKVKKQLSLLKYPFLYTRGVFKR
ncbi:MAG: response regulator [Anaerolineaceae bacterium]|nr:response regulator [Anaerolineaceae bacterium]